MLCAADCRSEYAGCLVRAVTHDTASSDDARALKRRADGSTPACAPPPLPPLVFTLVTVSISRFAAKIDKGLVVTRASFRKQACSQG